MKSNEYDVIVVGLGCIGLSTTYYLSSKGYKVLGLEQNPSSGYLGTGCFGETRPWHYMNTDIRYVSMFAESMHLWRRIEKSSKTKLLD